MDSAQFAAYAREQIRTADVILAQHSELIVLCSCGRPLPCSVAASLARRRQYFVDCLAWFDAPTVLGIAPIGGALDVEIVDRMDM